MTIASVASLVEALRQQRLLNPAQFDEVSRKLARRHTDPRALAKDLVHRGWLTPQQINQLFTARPAQAIMPAAGIPRGMPLPAAPAPVYAAPPSTPSYRRRRSSPLRWLLLNLLGLSLIGGLGYLLYYSYKHASTAGPDTEAERQRLAEGELEGLRARITEKPEEQLRLRRDLLTFRNRYIGTPQTVEAGVMLSQLPTPLDQLNPTQIPVAEQDAKPPAKVVAVFGESRSRHWGPARFVFFGNSASYVSLGDDRALRFWNVANGHEEVPPLALGTNVPVIAFGYAHGIKSYFAATTDGEVILWDGGATRTVRKGPIKQATAVAVSPDGQRVASAGDDNKLILWELATGKEISPLEGHTKAVISLAFSRDGKSLISGGLDNVAFVWSTESGAAQKKFSNHTNAVRCVALSPDNKTAATGSDDANVKVWDLDSGNEKVSYEEHQSAVTALVFSPNGRSLASGSTDQTVRLWDVTKPEVKTSQAAKGHRGTVWSVAFSLEGKTLASAGEDGTIRLWDASTATKLVAPGGQEGPVLSVAVSTDAAFVASGSADQTVVCWDVAERKPKDTLKGFEGAVRALAFNSRGDRLVTGDSVGDAARRVRLWEVPSLKEKGSLPGEYVGPVVGLSFGPDDQTLVVGTGDESGEKGAGHVRVIDFEQSADRFEKMEQSPTRSLAVAPNNKLLAAGAGDGTIRILDYANGNELHKLNDAAGLAAVAFAADSKTLATGGRGGQIKLWDTATGKEKQSLKAEAGDTLALAYSLDGKRLASAHRDGWLILWDATNGQRVEGWQMPGAINAIAFATDSRHLVTGNSNGTVYVFRLAALKKKETSKKVDRPEE